MNVNCKTPFFIWFTGRTGSTLLCDLLNSHPDIYCRMEDFSELAVPSTSIHDFHGNVVEFNGAHYVRKIFAPGGTIEHPNSRQVVDYLKTIFSAAASACGFKFKFPSQAAVYPEVIPALHQVNHLRVIALVRDNPLKQAVSLSNVERIRALKNKVSCNVTSHVELEPLQIDIQQVLNHARYFLESRKEFDQITRRFTSVLRITYEQLYSDTTTTTRSILNFLQVDPEFELATRVFKATPNLLSRAVSNYDQLVTAVAGTELEAFLDENSA